MPRVVSGALIALLGAGVAGCLGPPPPISAETVPAALVAVSTGDEPDDPILDVVPLAWVQAYTVRGLQEQAAALGGDAVVRVQPLRLATSDPRPPLDLMRVLGRGPNDTATHDGYCGLVVRTRWAAPQRLGRRVRAGDFRAGLRE